MAKKDPAPSVASAGARQIQTVERTEPAMTTVQVKLPQCRTDVDAFFQSSGYYRKGARWTHYPLLAFEETPEGVEVHIIDTAARLRASELPDATPCLQQWGGEWKSDFSAFTLGQARAALG